MCREKVETQRRWLDKNLQAQKTYMLFPNVPAYGICYMYHFWQGTDSEGGEIQRRRSICCLFSLFYKHCQWQPRSILVVEVRMLIEEPVDLRFPSIPPHSLDMVCKTPSVFEQDPVIWLA